jgi:hypothetical protein
MDHYIDNEETQSYGPQLRANLTTAFAGSPKAVTDFVKYLVGLQQTVDESMDAAMTAARGATSDSTTHAADGSPEAKNGRELLVGIAKHLESKRALGEWTGDTKIFFPKGLGAVGHAASEVLAAIRTAMKGFDKDGSVPDAKKLMKRLVDAEKKLDTTVSASRKAVKGARKGLSEQSTEKQGWRRNYRGVSLITEGLLVLADRASELASVVPHLSAPGGGKKKKAPAKDAPGLKPGAPTAG